VANSATAEERHIIYMNLRCPSSAEVVDIVGRARSDAETGTDGTMGRDAKLDVIGNDQPVLLRVTIKTMTICEEARPGDGQGRTETRTKGCGAHSNRQQAPPDSSLAPANSAHNYCPARLLGHNYNQLLPDSVPG